MEQNPSVMLRKLDEAMKEGDLTPLSNHYDFFVALKDLRSTVKSGYLNPENKKIVMDACKLIDKTFTDEEFTSWLNLKCQDLFTWNDYSRAWYKRNATQGIYNEYAKNFEKSSSHVDDTGLVATWAISLEVCMAYYQFNKIYNNETEDDFFNHPPYDYTRPHNWAKEPDFFSMGEAITAMINLANNTGKSYLHMKILEKFSKTHAPFFPKQPSKLEDLRIPYDYYLKCQKESRDPLKIKPWSIEICCYYVQQNGLDTKYIYDQEAPKNHEQQTNFCYYYCPSFKFFDVFDLTRFLSAWNMFLSHFEAKHNMNGMKMEDFFAHCKYFKFIRYPGEAEDVKLPIDKFFWYGIYQDEDNQHWTYRQKFTQTLSFLGDVINAISFSLLLESQIIRCKASTKQGFAKLETTQKAALGPVLEKYQKVRQWLETQKQNKTRPQIQKPGWKECDAEKLLDMVSYMPRSEEVHSLEKLLSPESVTQVPKSSMIYQSTINKLSTSLGESDITHGIKDYNRITLAVHGLAGLGSSKPYPYHKDLRIPKTPKSDASKIPSTVKDIQNENLDRQFTAKPESDIY